MANSLHSWQKCHFKQKFKNEYIWKYLNTCTIVHKYTILYLTTMFKYTVRNVFENTFSNETM